MALPSLDHAADKPPARIPSPGPTPSGPRHRGGGGVQATAVTDIAVAGRRIRLLARRGLPLVDLRLVVQGGSIPIGEIRGAASALPHLTIRSEHTPWACGLAAYNQLRTCAMTFWRTAQGDHSYWPGIGSIVLAIQPVGPARNLVVHTYRYTRSSEISLGFLSREPRDLGRVIGLANGLPSMADWPLTNSEWVRSGSHTRQMIDHASLCWHQREAITDRTRAACE